MKVSQIHDILDMSRRARNNGDIFNVCLVGPPGLGKTEIIGQWAAKNELRTIVMTLSSYDPPDFKGFPVATVVNGRQRLSFATPDFWPEDGEGVIVLEEMNRAPTSIMQCILSLGDIRRGFDGYKLPEGWMVVAAINPEDSMHDVNSMDPALKDRFEMFQVGYNKEDLLSYARSTKWSPTIINFIEGGFWQYKTPEDLGNMPGTKYVASRTWSKVNTAMRTGLPNHLELLTYETILGFNVAKDFYSFQYDESPVLIGDLKKNLKTSLKKLQKYSDPENYNNGMISITVKDIIEDGSIEDETLLSVVRTIPVEQSVVLLRELEFRRKKEKGEEKYDLINRFCDEHSDIKKMFKSVIKYGT